MVKVVRPPERGEVTKTILAVIKVAGILSIALVAPNVIGALDKLGIIQTSNRKKEIIDSTTSRLIRKGYLKRNEDGYLRLTKKGREKLDEQTSNDYVFEIPKKWDKKWRVVTFDIPEKRKTARDRLRRALISIGFCRMQNSVWIFPYDCEDLTILLKAEFKMGDEVIYFETGKFAGDQVLRNYFKYHFKMEF
ncbi:MAG: CRISPR-associated endonuclease Cas2 [bacterium]